MQAAEKALGGCPALRNVERDGALCFFAIENQRGFGGDETIRQLVLAIERLRPPLA